MTETTWRTHRLELDDQSLREWDATVLACRRGRHRPRPVGLLPRRRRPAAGPRRAALGRRADPHRRRAQGRRPVPDPGRRRPGAAAGDRGARRGRGRPAHRADADALGPARAVRRRLPRLRLAGDRRQHGAVLGPDGLRPAAAARRASGTRSRRPATPRSRPAAGSTCGCCPATTRSRSPTSSAPRPTWSRPRSRRSGSSTSSASTSRPTAARMSRRPAQIGRIEVVKIENKGKGFRRLRIRIAD